jgi:MFS transporter, DHA1 family, staphyloferrin A biosynthesis exporter
MNQSENSRSRVSAIGLRTFSSLRHPVYRLYFLGMLGQFASMNMQMVTSSLLIYRVTGSAALLGAMSLTFAVPMIIFSLFGGGMADRMQKKRLLMITLLCSAVTSTAIAFALTTGIISRENPNSAWILLVSSLVQGTIMGIMLPARQSIIPEIVSRDQAMNAVALNVLGMNVLRLAAPGLAGFLIDAFGFQAVYFCMAGLNLYAAIFLIFVPHTSRIIASGENILKDIRNGFDYLRKDTTIMIILLFHLVVIVLAMPGQQQLLPIYVDDILKVGATGMGLLLSISGAGALVGSLIMAYITNKKRGLLLIIAGIISGVSLLGFAFSTSMKLSLAFFVFAGLGQTVGTICSALLQTYTESRFMGRIMSILMMEWGVVNLFAFAAGLMAETLPVQWVVGSFAMTLILLSVLTLLLVPRLRKLD